MKTELLNDMRSYWGVYSAVPAPARIGTALWLLTSNYREFIRQVVREQPASLCPGGCHVCCKNTRITVTAADVLASFLLSDRQRPSIEEEVCRYLQNGLCSFMQPSH